MISGSIPAVFTDNRHTIHFHVVQFINDSFAGALYPYIIRPGSQRDPRFDRHPVIRAHSGKEAPLTTWKKKLRAATYCRVSTGTDLQDGSFETQCSYYQRRIEEDPALVCAGIYGDQGKSGRSIRSRPALQQLLNDCEEGRIDLILTKSVSRFARNLQECVEMTRRLSDLGVTVRFEREGLDTGSMDGELMLGILTAIAQEESTSISSNIQWSRKKHLEKSQPWEKARYGYISVGKEHIWQVVPREATIVHRAF